MRYGLGYLGSKNGIAEQIVDQLPKADTLIDLFCGGGAITHCAMLKGKYNNYIMNDIDADIVNLFVGAIQGKYKDEKRWISREDFFELKDIDSYIKYCWSFGNKGESYLYGKEIEPWKKALHYARVFNDYSLLKEMGIESDGSRIDIKKHYVEYKQKYIDWYKTHIGGGQQEGGSLPHPKRLHKLQNIEFSGRVESLQRLQSLQSFNLDYQDVIIPDNSIIYCDIPYNNTNCGSYNGFDHNRFYEWAKEKDNIFISEYNMPEPFVEIYKIPKNVLVGQNTNGTQVEEKLYTTKQTIEKFNLKVCKKIELF